MAAVRISKSTRLEVEELSVLRKRGERPSDDNSMNTHPSLRQKQAPRRMRHPHGREVRLKNEGWATRPSMKLMHRIAHW